MEVSFDELYKGGPIHPMSAWFREPLEKNLKAKKGWDALTPGRYMARTREQGK
jgi:hypothetical protein